MPSSDAARRAGQPLLTVAFAVAYVAAAALGRLTTLEGTTSFALVWPAAGVGVLWFLVRGAGVLSIDTLLLAAAAFTANATTGLPFDQSLVLVVSNLVQTWVAVLLLRRWSPEMWGCGGERALDSPWLTIRLVLTMIVGMLAGAAVGLVGVALVSEHVTFTQGLLWFDRNLCGALAVTVLGLVVGRRLTGPRPPAAVIGGLNERLELLAASVFTVAMYALTFMPDGVPAAFQLLVPTVWFGVRFATVIGVWHSIVVGAATIVLTLAGQGPFARADSEQTGVILAQFFLATLLVTGLLLSTGRDERRTLARELAAAEEAAVYQAGVLNTVIASMAEGLAVVDEAGDILMVNPAAVTALGFDAEAPPGSVYDLPDMYVDGERLPDALRPSRRALEGETVRNAPVVFRVPGDEGRVLSVSAAPLPRDEHDRARAVLLLRDTTTEHAQRQELAAFAGVVAHDLRNPLTAIDGWTELLDEAAAEGELKPEVVREFLGRVRSSSNRMHGLILHLLAHATSKNRTLSLTKLDLTEAATRIAAARDASDFVSVGPIPPVHGDRVLVDQVLENLIGNALKYVAAGVRPHVDVRGRLENRMVRVCVADNGIGLPEGQHESVFDEFHRVHTSGYEGTGLGLAIARRIVTRHGGLILARDNPSGGTIFEFTLPSAA
jgi:PAS domain S-box-containing protein